MTESPYAMPVEDLEDAVRVPLAEQVVDQPARLVTDWPARPFVYGDGMSGDVDGDC